MENTSRKKKKMTQDDIMNLLDNLYLRINEGVPAVSKSVSEMADEYLNKNNQNREKAAKKMLSNQVAKCTTSGFISGLGGVITMPVAIPANVGSVLYVQMRMIACIAYMAGYDLNSDQVQTFVYACLAGVSLAEIVKQTAKIVGTKIAVSSIKKIPGKVLTKINQKVGFRLLTKFGSKGVINIAKLVPLVGGLVGGSFDLIDTKIIGNRAYKWFIESDFECNDDNDEILIEAEDIDY